MLNKDSLYALKLIRSEISGDSVQRKRFKHESLIIDALDHPNIVRIVERGEHEDGLYLVMEYLDGQSLRQWMNQCGLLEIEDGLAIGRQIAAALTAVHEKQVIHRDLKPENVMLIDKGENPRHVKLLDFGLAKSQQMSQLTESGVIIGTLGYLSPEQVLKRTLTSAVDIFSLGVILYEMLSGLKPFVAETAVITLSRILVDMPPPLHSLRPGVPEQLSRLVEAMLAKDSGVRPDSQAVYRCLCQNLSQVGG
jgi:eukaryotic-like serine/threonine-protein kinase